MISITVPGGETFCLEHLVLDFNGTIALDGTLLEGVKERLVHLSQLLAIHVITADTHNSVAGQLRDLPCSLHIITPESQDRQKKLLVEELASHSTMAIGNGNNDALMLQTAALGVCLLQEEGASTRALSAAQVVCRSIHDALDLLGKPDRLRATLRN